MVDVLDISCLNRYDGLVNCYFFACLFHLHKSLFVPVGTAWLVCVACYFTEYTLTRLKPLLSVLLNPCFCVLAQLSSRESRLLKDGAIPVFCSEAENQPVV